MEIRYHLLGEADRGFTCLEEAYVIASLLQLANVQPPNGLPAIRPAPPRNVGKVEFAA